MASAFVVREQRGGSVRFRVRYRLGGRETRVLHGGSFPTMREARIRRDWIAGELAALRVPDLGALAAAPAPADRVAAVLRRWRDSRRDVAAGTRQTYEVALGRIEPRLGDLPLDQLDAARVDAFVGDLAAAGLARESIRKTLGVLAQALDWHGVDPNPARDRRTVRLPAREHEQINPPTAEHVAAVYRRLAEPHRLPLLWLDWSGARVSSVDLTLVGDYDEPRRRVRLRAATTKTRRALWVELHPALADAVEASLPHRRFRDHDARLFADSGADALRSAIGKACKAEGIPVFSPHDLRHRRISLLHLQGVPWARIGEFVGQRNLAVTANTYTHVLTDEAELDYANLRA